VFIHFCLGSFNSTKFCLFVYEIDGFQFEHVSTLNKKLEISFFVIMWIEFA
jgi:hypothetical protein